MPRKIKILTNCVSGFPGSSTLLDLWQNSLRKIELRCGWMWADPVAELDATVSALYDCAELREATFKYAPDVQNVYKGKLLDVLDAVKNKRYLKALDFLGEGSEEEYFKGRFNYYIRLPYPK